MAVMSGKEWAEEYRRINAAELEDRKRRLPLLSPEESIRRYFALCEFLVKFSPEAREAFEEDRHKHYLDLEMRFKKAARRRGYAFPG